MFYYEYEAKKRFKNPVFFTVLDRRHNHRHRLAAKNKATFADAVLTFLREYNDRETMECEGVYITDLIGPDFEISRHCSGEEIEFCDDEIEDLGDKPEDFKDRGCLLLIQ